MASYGLTGTGTQAITLGTKLMRVTVETYPLNYGTGRATPQNLYDIALLRFAVNGSWYPPVPVVGGPQAVPVPDLADTIGWTCFGATALLVEETVGVLTLVSSSLDGLAAFPGEEFAILFMTPQPATVGDWLTVQATTEPLGFSNRWLNNASGFIYTSSGTDSHGPAPVASGVLPATLSPSMPGGTYEVRYYSNDTSTLFARSASFTVS